MLYQLSYGTLSVHQEAGASVCGCKGIEKGLSAKISDEKIAVRPKKATFAPLSSHLLYYN